MQRIDKEAVSQFGMAADQLMEKAGTLMAERIMSLPGMGKNHRICIFCRPGHNGGDGLVVARKLLQQGFQYVDVWKMPLGASSMLFELNLRRLQEAKASVRE